MSDTEFLTTGEVADLLTSCGRPVLEVQLSHAIRTGRIPSPPLRAGRRLWSRCHVFAAAEHVGLHFSVVLRELTEREREAKP